MTVETQRAAIISRFKTQFDLTYPAVQVRYENHDFNQPDNTTWVALHILGSDDSFQANLGVTNVTERHVGIVQIDIISPEDSGTKTTAEIADFCGKIFSRYEVKSAANESITFKTPSHTPMGVENGQYRHMVRISFRRDERL